MHLSLEVYREDYYLIEVYESIDRLNLPYHIHFVPRITTSFKLRFSSP